MTGCGQVVLTMYRRHRCAEMRPAMISKRLRLYTRAGKLPIITVFVVLAGIIIPFASGFGRVIEARAAETEELPDTGQVCDDIDYQEIQNVVDDITGQSSQFDFKEYVGAFIRGEKPFSLSVLWKDMLDGIRMQFANDKNTVIRLLSIAVIAAVFTNFSRVFGSNQVAETGFYVTYLLMFAVLTTSFLAASSLAVRTLSLLLDFMKVLLPTYFLTIAFSAGARTSLVFYESTLFMISAVDLILIKIILPVIQIYFVLVLANNLSKEDMLSKLTELLEMIIQWTLKTLMGAVIGFNVIQGIIVPAADYVKNSAFMKAAGVIPGIGNALGSVTETVLGAGVLVKNAVGAAGLVVIVIICAIPLLKLAVYALIYKFGTALVQPISDKRILNCMNASVQSARLLLYTVGIGAVLFLLTIAIISSTTNLHLS